MYVAEPEEVHVVRDPGAAVLPDGRGAGEQHRSRANPRGRYVPNTASIGRSGWGAKDARPGSISWILCSFGKNLVK